MPRAESDTQLMLPLAAACQSAGLKDYLRRIEGEPRVHDQRSDLASKETPFVTLALEAIGGLFDRN